MSGREYLFRRASDKPLDLHGLLLVVLAASWLAGILLSAWLSLPQAMLLATAVVCVATTGIFWHQATARLATLALLCFCLGAWRYTTVSPLNDPWAIRAEIGPRTLEIQGTIADEPRLENHSTLLIVTVSRISMKRGQSWQIAHGTLEVQALGATFDDPYGPHYGDSVQLTGRLTAPPAYSTPETQASMAFPRMTITSRGGNPLLSGFYRLRTLLAGMLAQALPQPFAALLIALLTTV